MLALEKPHCGVSGVPFIKRTTGADATALSIAALVSDESNLVAMLGVNLEANRGAGRTAWRNAYSFMLADTHNQYSYLLEASAYRGKYWSCKHVDLDKILLETQDCRPRIIFEAKR